MSQDGGSGGGAVRQEASAGVVVCLSGCTYCVCRPVLSQRALWKGRNVMLQCRHELWWSLSAGTILVYEFPHFHPRPPFLLFLFSFFTWAERLQAPGAELPQSQVCRADAATASQDITRTWDWVTREPESAIPQGGQLRAKQCSIHKWKRFISNDENETALCL